MDNKEYLITSRTDWTPNLIKKVYAEIEEIALNDMQLDVYPNQIEVITAEQMIDAYASAGMPVTYHHWSFGKEFLRNWTSYQKGKMGLAYEIVINSNPCIAYLMEENPMIMQALVIAHASFGHNYVFKNNYVFKEWTDAAGIVDYMLFAKQFIKECEDKYGEDAVEQILDAAHALARHGVDKRQRKAKKKLTPEQKAKLAAEIEEEENRRLDLILKRTTINSDEHQAETPDFVGEEENLLYFIYKNSPVLETWQREILRIVYKIEQYFYPQRQTQVLNEGFATFTHWYIMNKLEEKGIISPDAQIAWIHSHSNVIYQSQYGDAHYSGKFNPYALGFAIFKDIKRICENPTEEDRQWFPDLIGKDWRDATKEAVQNFRDESFIEQYLSPKLMRDFRMFFIEVDEDSDGIVTEISDDVGYRNLRHKLAEQYLQVERVPEIVVRSADMMGDRTLTLEYRPYKYRSIHEGYARKTLKLIKPLWGYGIDLVEVDYENNEEEVELASVE